VDKWEGCSTWNIATANHAGALRDVDYREKLAAAGFESIDIEPTRVYDIEDARRFLGGQGLDVDAIAPQVAAKFMSAFVRAVKPAPAG